MLELSLIVSTADRQISGSPNDINARESKKDQKPVPARQVVRICLIVTADVGYGAIP